MIKHRWLWVIVLILPVVFLLGYEHKENEPQSLFVSSIVISKVAEINYEELIIVEEIEQVESMDLDVDSPSQVDDYIIEDVNEIPTEEKVEPVVEQVILPITQRQANDPYPDNGETVATISIPSLNLYKVVTYGDSQSNIDNYDICLRSYHRFNQMGAILVGGHNFKSFASLQYINIGDEINIHSYYGDFTFIVDSVTLGTTDGENVYSSDGAPLIDFYDLDTKLYLYTCDNGSQQNRLVVSAHKL